MKSPLWGGYISVFLIVLATAACNSDQLENSSVARSDAIERGASLYNKLCISCHGGAIGGEITDRPPRHNTNGHTWHHSDQQLKNIILDGFNASTEPLKMPAFKAQLKEQEVEDILDFLRTWWTEEQRVFQRTVTQQEGDYKKGR